MRRKKIHKTVQWA